MCCNSKLGDWNRDSIDEKKKNNTEDRSCPEHCFVFEAFYQIKAKGCLKKSKKDEANVGYENVGCSVKKCSEKRVEMQHHIRRKAKHDCAVEPKNVGEP